MSKKQEINVLKRKDEMEDAKNSNNSFSGRWGKNENRVLAFMEKDGNTHPPTAWSILRSILGDVLEIFNGNVDFVPTIEESRVSKNNFSKKFRILTEIYNQENEKVGVQDERAMAIEDALKHGIGVLFEGYIKEKGGGDMAGIVSSYVDVRDFFIDDAALKFYDTSDISGARDCIQRKYFTKEAFNKAFNKDPFNQKLVNQELQGGVTRSRNEGLSLIESDVPTELIEIFEYWSKKKHIVETKNGNRLLEEDNPYELLPYTVYIPFPSRQTMWNYGIIDTVSDLIEDKKLLYNLNKQNAILNSYPKIYADESTGLIPGEKLTGGIETVQLNEAEDIRTKIQEIRLGGITNSAQLFKTYIDDEIIIGTGIDVNALRDRPDELAAQTKVKALQQQKRIRGVTKRMILNGETYRAILRGRNILKYSFKGTKDLVLINKKSTDTGFDDKQGENSVIQIDEKEWKNFQFNVIIKQKIDADFEKTKMRDDMMKFTQILFELAQNNPDILSKFNFESFIKGVLKTFDTFDQDSLFNQKEEKKEQTLEDPSDETLKLESSISQDRDPIKQQDSLKKLISKYENSIPTEDS